MCSSGLSSWLGLLFVAVGLGGIEVADHLLLVYPLPMAVMLMAVGAIVAMKDGAHLGTDALVSRLPLRGKQVFFVISHGLMLYACWLLFWGAWDLVQINLSSTSAVMEVSMAWFYAPGLVLSFFGALVLVNNLLRLMNGQVNESELIGIRESEEEPVDLPAPVK